MTNFWINNAKSALVLAIAAAFLLIDAIYNGYPIVYSDTSTFLEAGFQLETPFDRPITYGLFLRATSLFGLSLWTVVIAQALLLAYLIKEFINKLIAFPAFQRIVFLSTTLLLGLFTSASWTVSQLIPDVFTATLILSFVLILQGNSRKKQIAFYSIFFVSTAMHMSHITFNVMFILLLLLFTFIGPLNRRFPISRVSLIICLILNFATLPTMGSALSKSKHAFFMGAMIEHGIAQTYLDEHCADKKFQLCEYRDDLPEKGWQFLWNEDSPFYQMGAWAGTKDEFNEIIWNTLTTPKYIGIHISASLRASADQLTKFRIGDGNGPFLAPTQLHERLTYYFPNSKKSYEDSRQNTENLQLLNVLNPLIYVVMVIALAILLAVFFRWNRLSKAWHLTLLVVVTGVLLNAWSCGTFANAIDRLGGRVMWLLPMLAITLLWSLALSKRSGHLIN